MTGYRLTHIPENDILFFIFLKDYVIPGVALISEMTLAIKVIFFPAIPLMNPGIS
jgi:hypothetical protein